MSYLAHLECSNCGRIFDDGRIQTNCLGCQAPLLARYDLARLKEELDRDEFCQRRRGQWRWKELLPVKKPENFISLGEGDTPLLPLPRLADELGLHRLYIKDESLNPTGTFKARGLAVALSKAKELGIQKVVIPTAGNAGGALATYAARAGQQAFICMPRDTPQAIIDECRIMGATVYLVDGLINDSAVIAAEKARSEGWFDVSTFKEPYRVEGKKIMGLEIAEVFQWELPDVIVYPTGGGTGLVGMWKAFAEMEQLGWLNNEARPRMVAVQAEGCAPVVKAFFEGSARCEYWPDAHTLAAGLRVPMCFADRLVLSAIRESGGTALSVSDQEIVQAQRWLASTEGIFAAPEGAATLAGLVQLVKNKWVHPDDRIVMFNTGTGIKYLE